MDKILRFMDKLSGKIFFKIGKLIKLWATIIFVGGVTASIILAIVFFIMAATAGKSMFGSMAGTFVGLGFAALILGPISSWVSSFLLYGFGQLIDNSDKMVEENQKNQKTAPIFPKPPVFNK